LAISAARIVARQAERGLRQIIGAEAEEIRHLRDAIRGERRARQLDHGADEILELFARHLPDFGGDLVDHRLHQLELLGRGNQRDHDLGDHRFAGLLLHLGHRLENGAGLHLVDLRIGNAEAHAAMAEHRVELVQLVGALLDLLDVDAEIPGDDLHVGGGLGQELVQRRIEQADRDRQPRHDLE
jgi:hypothetical protein